MKIEINDHRKIFAVQEEFQSKFPNLKIEFFAKPSSDGGVPSKKLVNHASKTLGECRVIHTKGQLTIEPGMTVADLKRSMEDRYGLSIEVFRKAPDGWIEASSEGVLSLEDQNKIEVVH